jgi:hypothetical protein
MACGSTRHSRVEAMCALIYKGKGRIVHCGFAKVVWLASVRLRPLMVGELVGLNDVIRVRTTTRFPFHYGLMITTRPIYTA